MLPWNWWRLLERQKTSFMCGCLKRRSSFRDNFYASFPNLYAIRGTPYRDVRSWADANDMMLKDPNLVPGHTRPILGKEAVAQALADYRDAIRFVFNKTIEGMNKGMSPDELVDYVKLPTNLAKKDYLGRYYDRFPGRCAQFSMDMWAGLTATPQI